MPDLEPITREETLLDGGDLTPITRKEMFIKRIYDKTQSVPEPITREEYFLNKAGEGSGDVTIEQLNVTENGTYSESGKAYSPVVVNVPIPPIPENAYLLNNLSGLPADIASFNDGTDLPMASLKVTVAPYQDLSHGDPSPENICPIIGWDKVNVTRTGKNLWGYGNVSGTKQVDVEVDIPIGSFDFSCEITSADVDGTTSLIIFYYDDDTTFLTRLNRNTRVPYTFTATKHIKKISFYAGYNSSQSAGDTFTFANIQLEIGTTATTYSPYNGATYTIDLNGTRYGGEVDATNGTMDDTLDHIASYNGEALPSTWISDRDVYAEGTTPTIGAEVVYTRATPITVQLAPTPVKSLEGKNNIFADCGQVTEVKYFKKA